MESDSSVQDTPRKKLKRMSDIDIQSKVKKREEIRARIRENSEDIENKEAREVKRDGDSDSHSNSSSDSDSDDSDCDSDPGNLGKYFMRSYNDDLFDALQPFDYNVSELSTDMLKELIHTKIRRIRISKTMFTRQISIENSKLLRKIFKRVDHDCPLSSWELFRKISLNPSSDSTKLSSEKQICKVWSSLVMDPLFDTFSSMLPCLCRNEDVTDNLITKRGYRQENWNMWIHGMLVFAGEAKKHDDDESLEMAKTQMINSTKATWKQLGNMKYIFALITAGKLGKIGVLRNTNGKISFEELSPLNISYPAGIIKAIKIMWNILRWSRNVLQIIQPLFCLPPTFTTPSPFYTKASRVSQTEEMSTFVVYTDFVTKSFKLPVGNVATFLRVYKAIKDNPFTAHYNVYFGDTQIDFSKVHPDGSFDFKYSITDSEYINVLLKIKPVGVQEIPKSPSALYNAIVNILQFLVFLHKKGIVHKDLRWPNIIRDGVLYFVVDFELAGIPGEIIQFSAGHCSFFESAVFYKLKPYSFEDDIFQVGELIAKALCLRIPSINYNWPWELVCKWDEFSAMLKNKRTSAARALEILCKVF